MYDKCADVQFLIKSSIPNPRPVIRPVGIKTSSVLHKNSMWFHTLTESSSYYVGQRGFSYMHGDVPRTYNDYN